MWGPHDSRRDRRPEAARLMYLTRRKLCGDYEHALGYMLDSTPTLNAHRRSRYQYP
jgi:hypothetical protein